MSLISWWRERQRKYLDVYLLTETAWFNMSLDNDTNKGLVRRRLINLTGVSCVRTNSGFRNYCDIEMSDGWECTRSGTSLNESMCKCGLAVIERIREKEPTPDDTSGEKK